MKKHFDGAFDKCLGYKCANSCCAYGFGESNSEYIQSPRAALEEALTHRGVEIEKDRGFVRVTGCSDGKHCILLNEYGHFGDIRPLACKIYPFYIASKDDYRVEIDLHPCPAISGLVDIPESYAKQTSELIQNHFQLYFDRFVTVIFCAPHQTAPPVYPTSHIMDKP